MSEISDELGNLRRTWRRLRFEFRMWRVAIALEKVLAAIEADAGPEEFAAILTLNDFIMQQPIGGDR